MSVFARFKRQPEGLRAIVELWESTPMKRRQKMIEVGMAEDPVFSEKILQYVFTFDDILGLPDVELAELMVVSPPRVTAMAISGCPDETKLRFIRNSKPHIAAEIRDCAASKYSAWEVDGARLKVIEKARELERKGAIYTKKIPLEANGTAFKKAL